MYRRDSIILSLEIRDTALGHDCDGAYGAVATLRATLDLMAGEFLQYGVMGRSREELELLF